jgi:hypothetical protein
MVQIESAEPTVATTGVTELVDIFEDKQYFEIATLDKLKEWMERITRFGGHRSIEWVEDTDTELRVHLYTDTNEYQIKALLKDNGRNYLGCVASSRKPRAGETWTRGNDLADGPLTFKTWYDILADIVAYETVKVHPSDPRPQPDEK